MKRLGMRLGVVAVVGFALMTPAAFADDKKGDDHKGHDHGPGEHGQHAMQEMMTQMAAPGPQHKMLQNSVGTWKTEMKHWMEPGKPIEAQGVSVIKSVMGGRYIEEHFTSNMMGQEFKGRGIFGYDKMKQKYVSVWFDNMGTGLMTMEGTYDEATKTMTTMGEMEAMPGVKSKMRIVEKEIDKNTKVMEMYMAMGGAEEVKTMEIKYTREKKVADAK